MVESRDEREQVTLSLSDRFHQLVDSLAMQQGIHDEGAYLEHWRRAEAEVRPGGAREAGEAVVAELEGRFTEFVARAFRGV
jgi:hypothetical protein